MTAPQIATERVYVTADGRYVPHGDESAAFLVAAVGGPLPADFHGFNAAGVAAEATPALEPEPNSDAAAPDDKAPEPEPAPAPRKPRKS